MGFKDRTGIHVLLGVILLALAAWKLPFIFSHLLVVAFWLALAAACAMIGYVVYWFIRNRLSPVQHVHASVLRRRKKDWDVSVMGDTPEMAAARLGMLGRHPEEAAKAWHRAAQSPDVPEITIYEGIDFYVTFSFNGREVEFKVPGEVYVKSPKGTDGLLVFQREEFKDFIPRVR